MLSDALTSERETVCVSVRSTSVKSRIPEVALLEVSGPPYVPVPAVKAMVCAPVVMTGWSLVPVTVMVIGMVVY